MAIQQKGGPRSVDISGINVTGQTKTAKALYTSDDVYVPNMPQPGYQVPYPPVEKARRPKAEKVETAPDEEPVNSTFGQKQKRGDGKGVNTTLRLRPEVVEAWKAHFPQHTAAMKRMIEEFAHDQGWL